MSKGERSGGTKTIKIGYLILDDGPSSRQTLKGIVRQSVESACQLLGIDPEAVKPEAIKEASTLTEAEQFVVGSDSLPYWLLVDNRLEGESGQELVKLVEKLGYPADVLYYSRAGALPSLKRVGPPRYGKVISALWDDLPARISVMAQEFLFKWTDPEYIRGLVLSRAVDVEIAMDDCILAFFKVDDTKEPTFRGKLLGTHGAELFARFDVIEKAVLEVRKPASKGGPAEGYEKITKETAGSVFRDTRDVFAHNLLRKNPNQPFGLQITHKSGGDIPYRREALQQYFLTCSRMLADLERLEENLKRASGPKAVTSRVATAVSPG
jgi:hypothetical protein